MFAPPKVSSKKNRRSSVTVRGGFTLIEMLVTITILLVLLGTVMTIFGLITGSVADSRASMEMIDRQRAATTRLQLDLQGHTVHTMASRRSEGAEGYIEYIEGEGNDWRPAAIPDEDLILNDLRKARLLADWDDVLMMTVRSRGAPFVGRGPNGPIESNLAEVVWFVARPDIDRASKPLTLYRRALLIRPDLTIQSASIEQFNEKYDISARTEYGPDGAKTGKIILNSLADLTKPENRFAHILVDNKGRIERTRLRPFSRSSGRQGEDVIMTNCIGFDIKAYDPSATVSIKDETAMTPHDKGHTIGAGVRSGAYVDLNYAKDKSISEFSGPPDTTSGMSNMLPYIVGVYSTWPFEYEHDGIDQNGDGVVDEGVDGLDNAGEPGVVDDPGERETAPPYSTPLRGIQIQVKVYEPDSQAVRKVTITQDFMPQ